MKEQMKQALAAVGVFVTLAVALTQAAPVGTAFTYQGRLWSGTNAANGIFDFRFAIFDLASGGSAVAGPITNSAVAVSNGLLIVTLDFGVGVFTGQARWLEIAVRTNGVGAFSLLSPRQPLTPTPYALYATNAGAAGYATTAGSAASASAAPWGGLTGVPAGFADGLDNDTTYSAGPGLQLLGTVFSAQFAGSGTANTVARSDHHHDATYWKLTGNSGTTPDTHFLGTTDNQPFEIKVNRARALRLEPNANGYSANVVGGASNNVVSGGVEGATIAGGGTLNLGGFAFPNQVSANYGAVGGGLGNVAGGTSAAIGGGSGNWVNAGYAVIAGGSQNSIETAAQSSTIGGGYFNKVQTGAANATVSGGQANLIATNARYATIPGGFSNVVAGDYSLAAGRRAKARHTGAFVWADSTDADFASTASNQFLIRASGGVGINKTNPATALDINGTVTATAFVGGGAGLTGIGTAALADGSVTGDKIQDGAVGTADLANNAVTSAKIADGTIVAADVAPNTFWGTAGNSGTTPGTHFLGTTDNRPLEVWANGQRALRLEPGTNVAPNVVGGSASNAVGPGVMGATIAGGGTHGVTFSQFPAPGPIGPFPPTFHPNRVTGNFGTVGGGAHNFIGTNALAATVGGGYDNAVTDGASIGTVSGGANNWILTNATGAAIGGGRDNLIFPDSAYARVGGGRQNWLYAGAQYGTIAGGATNTIEENAVLNSIGGGWWNTIQRGATSSIIGGGTLHTIGTNAVSGTIAGGVQNRLGMASLGSTIGGGGDHLIANNTRYGTIPGGYNNTVGGDYGFAAGRRARALHPGAFVWADSANADFSSTGNDQFLVRASGGAEIVGSTNPVTLLGLRSSSDFVTALDMHNTTTPAGTTGYRLQVVGSGEAGRAGNFEIWKIGGVNLLTVQAGGNVGIGTTVPAAKLDVAGTVRATAFAGNGAGLTNCNARLLDGLDSTAFWKTGGNAGTTPGTHFLGTTDNQPLELRVNGLRVLRLESNTDGAPNVIGGSLGNRVPIGVVGATISGGGATNYYGTNRPNVVESDYGVVGGGVGNSVGGGSTAAIVAGGQGNVIGIHATNSAISGGYCNYIGQASPHGAIGGGRQNLIGFECHESTIGGGKHNRIWDATDGATIAGGQFNEIGYRGYFSTVGGGEYNNIAGESWNATIAGGEANEIGSWCRHSTVGGGWFNTIANGAPGATIAGGQTNYIDSEAGYSSIGGGRNNAIAADSGYATIAGGLCNTAGTEANCSTIGGGYTNTIADYGRYATIPGGYLNFATNYAFAAGNRAKARHTGAFVWADSQDADFASTGDNQFRVRAAGGAEIVGSTNPVTLLGLRSSSDFVTALDMHNTTTPAGTTGYRLQVVGSGGVGRAGNFEIWKIGGVNLLTVQAAGNVGIGTTAPGARLDVAGSVRLGVGGTTLSRVQAGTIVVGTGEPGVNVRTNTFPVPFSSTPKVIVAARGEDYDDTFAVTARAVTTTGFKLNILRLDHDVGWGQNLKVDWIAWE